MKTASTFAILFSAWVLPATASANLLVNPGFENVPNNNTGQGLMPSNWLKVSSSPDTYSNDGSYGLLPLEFGNFPGVTAHGGLRWVAGAGGTQQPNGEIIGQVLSAPLQAGVTYRFEAWLHQALRSDLNNPGGYDIWLDRGVWNAANRVLVGHIGDTTSPAAGWNLFGTNFTAPFDAATYTRFVFAPLRTGGTSGSAYPGLDDVTLTVVPEPASLTALGIGALALLRRRRA